MPATPKRTTKKKSIELPIEPQQAVEPAGQADQEIQREKRRVVQKSISNLNEVLKFKSFLSSSFEPEIEDCEIIVCFADLRGFTSFCQSLQSEMQDRKIQNFLKTYFKIYTEGLLQYIEEEKLDKESNINLVMPYLIPTMYKNLGDGMMIVWEIPSNLDLTIQGRIPQHILPLIFSIIRRFQFYFRNLNGLQTDSYSKNVESLKLGFGIAKGHAWRLNFGNYRDYAGSVVNLASRLQDCARPEGIVCQSGFSTWILDKLVDKGRGSIGTLSGLKGYTSAIEVWLSNEVDISQNGILITKQAPPSTDIKS